MSVGLIILSVLSGFLLYMLCFPLSVKVNTKYNIYCAGIPGIAAFRIFKNGEEWNIQYSVLFLKYKIDPSKEIQKFDHKLPERGKKIKKRKSRSVLSFFRLSAAILSTFRIRHLIWKIDTGDYPLNAQLIPLASNLSSNRVLLSVNFNNINEFYFLAQTRLINILYTTIRFYMFNR